MKHIHFTCSEVSKCTISINKNFHLLGVLFKLDNVLKNRFIKKYSKNFSAIKFKDITNINHSAILHISTRPEYKYQISYFMGPIAVGDSRCKDIQEAAEILYKSRYREVEVI